MKNSTKVTSMLVAALMAGTVCFAQAGADTYGSKCKSCHGADGNAPAAMAKMMGIKNASDPAIKGETEAAQIAAVTNGKGKMGAFKGKLTDAEIKAAVDYYRTLAK
jgi:mono/diheme cytochrome c family protein